MDHPHRVFRLRDLPAASVLASRVSVPAARCSAFRWKDIVLANDAGHGSEDAYAVLRLDSLHSPNEKKSLLVRQYETVPIGRFEMGAFVQWLEMLGEIEQAQRDPIHTFHLRVDHGPTACVYCALFEREQTR